MQFRDWPPRGQQEPSSTGNTRLQDLTSHRGVSSSLKKVHPALMTVNGPVKDTSGTCLSQGIGNSRGREDPQNLLLLVTGLIQGRREPCVGQILLCSLVPCCFVSCWQYALQHLSVVKHFCHSPIVLQ